jgi:DNA helicase HerA-like ATPase
MAGEQEDLSRSISDRLAEYRASRTELEQAILPLATSVDGRSFQFQSSLHGLALRAGGYVMLDEGGSNRLGQILTVGLRHVEAGDLAMTAGPRMPAVRAATGDGVVLDGDLRPFHEASVRPAEPGEVRKWLETIRPRRATLEIGELLHATGVAATLDAGGFDRHTFLCGQSGSGKTYALGLVIERLLLETGLRIVILDPNSDYVRLAETRASVERAVAARYAQATGNLSVWRAEAAGEQPIRLAFAELSPAAQAAILHLDPINDRAEYAALSAILQAREAGRSLITGLDELLSSVLSGAHELGLRAANLGVLDWSIWSRGRAGSLLEKLDRADARCVVIDLGSLDSREEQRVVAEATLSTLWERRARREPILIVIDEAHNICPAQPNDPVTALAAEHAVRIAAEGRKYGLYLLVSTQRPQKVQENVVSQCDNLLLMRMNSTADLEFIRSVFSFVPAGLLDRATSFRQGESLVAGKISSHAAHVRFGARVAEEGGADVPSSWAARRS